MRYKKVLIEDIEKLNFIQNLKNDNNKKPYDYLIDYIKSYNKSIDENSYTSLYYGYITSFLRGLEATEKIETLDIINIDYYFFQH